MIPREEIEFTLAMAEKGIRAEAPAKVMAELCRVYLAYLDAPSVEADCDSLVFAIMAASDVGKRFRLVAPPSGAVPVEGEA